MRRVVRIIQQTLALVQDSPYNVSNSDMVGAETREETHLDSSRCVGFDLADYCVHERGGLAAMAG